MDWFKLKRKPKDLSYAGLGSSPKEPPVKMKTRSEIKHPRDPNGRFKSYSYTQSDFNKDLKKSKKRQTE